jgi:hypothetical protein
MSTQITALDFEILKLKAMLSDILLEQKGLQTRLNTLNENEKNIIQKINDLTAYGKQQASQLPTPTPTPNDSVIELDPENIDEVTGQILPDKKTSKKK